MVSSVMYSDEEDSQDEQYVNYKQKYRELKKNLRYLIYENECFQDELRKAQRNFVSISRDKSFLLDRILKYEKPQGPSSDSEATESSDEEEEAKLPQNILNQRKKITKRKRSEAEAHNGSTAGAVTSTDTLPASHGGKQTPLRPIAVKPTPQARKPKKPPTTRKPSAKRQDSKDGRSGGAERAGQLNPQIMRSYHLETIHVANEEQVNTAGDMYDGVAAYEFSAISGGQGGHMTREEVERHLESRRFSPELNTTATVPAELFSQEPDPDSDFDDSEMCEYIQLDDDGQSADMILE